MAGFPDTVYPNATTQTRLASDTADNICWNKFAPADSPDAEPPNRSETVTSALTRITFSTIHTHLPLHTIADKVSELSTQDGLRIMVITGRGKRLAVESHHAEMQALLGEDPNVQAEMRKTLGDVGTYLMKSGNVAPLIVMQASALSQDY